MRFSPLSTLAPLLALEDGGLFPIQPLELHKKLNLKTPQIASEIGRAPCNLISPNFSRRTLGAGYARPRRFPPVHDFSQEGYE